MNKQQRYERGSRLIDDAHFVKEVLLTTAFHAEKWNVVVFEAYRASELLVKSIIYLTGYEPEEHHRLHDLVTRLSEVLVRERSRVPFVYRAIESNGNYYQVGIDYGAIHLLKQVNGLYTLLGSVRCLPNPYVPPRLVRNGIAVSIRQGENELLITCDSSLSDEVSYERKLLYPPDMDRLDNLKKLVEILLATREEAFYSERRFTRAEAESSKSDLDLVFQLSKAFEFFERI